MSATEDGNAVGDDSFVRQVRARVASPPPPLSPAAMEGSEAASQAAKLDPLQQRAVDIALSGKNLFLTGGPGTGKSFTLRHIIEQLRTKHYAERLAAHAGATGDPPRRTDSVLVTAPTGVAAILVGGQTLFAKPGPGKPLPTTLMFGNMWGNKDEWRKVRTVVVDEISMVDGEFFEWWHATLQKINSKIQLIVCGLAAALLEPSWHQYPGSHSPAHT